MNSPPSTRLSFLSAGLTDTTKAGSKNSANEKGGRREERQTVTVMLWGAPHSCHSVCPLECSHTAPRLLPSN